MSNFLDQFFLRNVVSVFCACGLNSETATKTKHNYRRNRVGAAFKDMFSYVAIPKNDRGQFPTQHNPIIMVRLAVAHVRHRASLTRYWFTGGYWRETRFTWNILFTSCSEHFSCTPLLCRYVYFNLLNLQQMIQPVHIC